MSVIIKSGDVMRPILKRQVKADSIETAAQRSKIFKDNLSRFFVHLYASIYGGRILKDPWGNGLSSSSNGLSYHFNPDIVRIERGRKIYTEEKVTGTRNSKISASVKQSSNNFSELLERIESREKPLSMIEYALFIYGPRSLNGLQNMGTPSLVKILALSQKRLLVVPLNLFLYLTFFSRLEIRNQTSSKYYRNSQEYHSIGSGILTKLLEGTPLTELGKNRFADSVLEYLCLDDIEVKKSRTSPIDVHYRGISTIEPFPVVKYFIPEGKYKRFTDSLKENHLAISQALGIRDLFAEARDTKEDLDF